MTNFEIYSAICLIPVVTGQNIPPAELYPLAQSPLVSNVPSLSHYRWVSRLLGWLWYPSWAPPVLFSIAFPFAFHISVFLHHFSSLAIEFQSCFFLTADVFAPIRSLFTYSLFWWVSRLGTGCWYPMLWSQRRNRCAHRAEMSIEISAWRGRTSDLGI